MTGTGSGILIVDKPEGVTSRDVVNRVQRLVRPLKCGHAGTLDPMATGVLLVCLGKATRLVPFLHEWPKHYAATFELGKTSDTDDRTGNVLEHEVADPPNQQQVNDGLRQFVGEIEQTPPAFSAVRIKGKRAYDLARQGKAIAPKSRRVTIHSIENLQYRWPILQFDMECGTGTYVRSVGRDLGQLLGCGAMMTALMRTSIGPFKLDDSMNWHDLEQAASLSELPLRNAAEAVQHLASTICTVEESHLLAQGKPLNRNRELMPNANEKIAALTPEGDLAAICEFNSAGSQLKPKLVFYEVG